MNDESRVFNDAAGSHRIPQDGDIYACYYCAKEVFISHEAAKAIFGDESLGVFCDDFCKDQFKAIRFDGKKD